MRGEGTNAIGREKCSWQGGGGEADTEHKQIKTGRMGGIVCRRRREREMDRALKRRGKATNRKKRQTEKANKTQNGGILKNNQWSIKQ